MAIGLKSRFMSTVSHELRTPLSTIMGYSHLIADNIYGEPSAGMLEALKKVIIAADHLLALINNILDFSQIGTGGMVIHREPVDLAVLLGEASASVAAILQGKPIVLSCDYAHSLPTVFTDREQLKQVLGHLLDNAVKFTPEGKIVLRASAAEGGVEILVEDTGIGIELENQEIIFDGFRQVEDTDTRNYGGLGLGLSMVRCQLELLGGEITVKSQVGQGSTFRVWVPIGKMK